MAGIGFRLRRLVEDQGLVGFLTGYSAAAAIMAGPWIVTILTVLGVALLGGDQLVFETYVTHVYQASLILAGFLQFPATRYLADLLYRQNYRAVFPAFTFTLVISLCCSTAVGLCWGLTTPGQDWTERVLAIALLNIITGQWIALIFLVTVHNYLAIILAFTSGGILSVYSSSRYFGFNDTKTILFAYAGGQALTLLLLAGVLMREYPSYQRWDNQALSWVLKKPSLPLAGGLFYIGVFADKFTFRYCGAISESRVSGVEVIAPWLYSSQPYEYLTFLAQLTIIPALAIFYIRVETGFFEVYKAFYKAIDEQKTLDELVGIKERIVIELKAGARSVGAGQAVVTLLCLLIAPELIPNHLLDNDDSNLLRAAIVASFFSILLLLIVVILLYFEFYNEACFLTLSFTILNFDLSLGSLYLPQVFLGWGSTLAAFLSLGLGAVVLWVRVNDLVYQTFCKAPVETIPQRTRGIPGVGRFRLQKERLSIDFED